MLRRRPSRRGPVALAVIAAVAALAACSSGGAGDVPTAAARPSRSTGVTHHPAATPAPVRPAVAVRPLAAGERWVNLGLPGGTYRPQAPAGGTDDYRCQLLDPHLTQDAYLTGAVLIPGNPKLVHHAILYRVDPAQVAAAKARDAADPARGWSCFGDPGLPHQGGVIAQLDAAPWVAAWATTGGEQRFSPGTGQLMKAGSRLVLQMHYNLLNGGGLDDTEVRLRMAPATTHLQQLHTFLLPAPVELPCTSRESGPLCDRTQSVFDVQRRFGLGSGATIAGLQLLCGGSMTHPKAGPVQSCARPVQEPMTIRAVAGHMHLLGRAVRVDVVRRSGATVNLIDIRVWNFDNQRATVLKRAVTVGPGDQLKVTCRHDASLRSQLPDLRKLPDRYVVWGEGSSDEMCLGIVSYT